MAQIKVYNMENAYLELLINFEFYFIKTHPVSNFIESYSDLIINCIGLE